MNTAIEADSREYRGSRALAALLALAGIGALPAGLGLIADPSGAALGLPGGLLAEGPLSDFTIPGIFLFVVLGLGALPVASGAWRREPWAGTAALVYGAVLLAWLTIQTALTGIVSPLQPLYGTVGLLIVVLSLFQRGRGGASGP